jgi:predicted phage tail protein
MITIKLYGHLGTQFGRIHKYAIRTPVEAVRALEANCRGFKKALLKDQKRAQAARKSHMARMKASDMTAAGSNSFEEMFKKLLLVLKAHKVKYSINLDYRYFSG